MPIPKDPTIIKCIEKAILRGSTPVAIRATFGMTHNEYKEFLEKHASQEILIYLMKQ